jgi:hypothetical protein
MVFLSNAAEKTLGEHHIHLVFLAVRLYRNRHLSSSDNIGLLLGESFESVQASITRSASPQQSSMPTQFSLSVAWQDDLPSGVKIAKISKNTFLGDFTNLTYVNKQNLGDLLHVMKVRGEKDTLLVTLDDATGRKLAEPLGCSKDQTARHDHQSLLNIRSDPKTVARAVNPSVLLSGIFGARMSDSAGAKKEPKRDDSPRRRKGATGWVEDNQTHLRDPHDRSTGFGIPKSDNAKLGADEGDQRTESAIDEVLSHGGNKDTRQDRSKGATKESGEPSSSMDLDDNIHESRRHFFGPKR